MSNSYDTRSIFRIIIMIKVIINKRRRNEKYFHIYFNIILQAFFKKLLIHFWLSFTGFPRETIIMINCMFHLP